MFSRHGSGRRAALYLIPGHEASAGWNWGFHEIKT